MEIRTNRTQDIRPRARNSKMESDKGLNLKDAQI